MSFTVSIHLLWTPKFPNRISLPFTNMGTSGVHLRACLQRAQDVSARDDSRDPAIFDYW